MNQYRYITPYINRHDIIHYNGLKVPIQNIIKQQPINIRGYGTLPVHQKDNIKNLNTRSTVISPEEGIIQISYSDLGDKTRPKQRKTEPFMGLEELFWQCYGQKPKNKL